jgi:hypothetical protein
VRVRGKSIKFLFLVAAIFAATAAWAGPPPDLVKLEKLTSLELAHVRDAGPVESDRRKQLFAAHQLEQQGEKALQAGDYKAAEDNLLKARVILRQLND